LYLERRCAMERPQLEVADIFRAYGAAYRREHGLTFEQHRVMRAITRCRTAALGGHVDRCTRCDALQISYNSCRNRFCPKCQGQARRAWVEAREADLLPIEYFHVVFTLPHALLPLLHYNRTLLLDLLFRAVSRTLLEFGERHLQGEIGVLAVLHTWGQTLCEHPHVHTIVTGGALSHDQRRWTSCRRGFLFAVAALAEVFRGKYIDGLRRAHRRGRLRLEGEGAALAEAEAFATWIEALYTQRWIVYAKRPFAGPRQVVRYLGRYTHRGPIANARLLSLEEGRVKFRYKNYRAAGQWAEADLAAGEFIRRYLLHVLPRGFVRIRYYGIYAASRRRQRLARCRTMLEETQETQACGEAEGGGADAQERESAERRCEVCGSGCLVRQAEWHAGERPPIAREAVTGWAA
jgi:hypothetical protein